MHPITQLYVISSSKVFPVFFLGQLFVFLFACSMSYYILGLPLVML